MSKTKKNVSLKKVLESYYFEIYDDNITILDLTNGNIIIESVQFFPRKNIITRYFEKDILYMLIEKNFEESYYELNNN